MIIAACSASSLSVFGLLFSTRFFKQFRVLFSEPATNINWN